MHRDIIVVGASAGGVEALSDTVAGLPAELDATVLVVLHLPATATSALPDLLQRRTRLPTTSAIDGEAAERGHIYIAPPDYHLLLNHDTIRVSRGPKENGHRPAIDTLFRSAARTHGHRVIGVVLSGTLDDGAVGLGVIASHGGTAIVQDPDDAAFSGMPLSALEAVPEATRAPARELGAILGEMSQAEVQREGANTMADETLFQGTKEEPDEGRSRRAGPPSAFTCPECHGTLFRVEESDLPRYRCRVGHGFSAESLLDAESEALEAALWSALRTLEERNDLMRRMAERARRQSQYSAADRFEDRVRNEERNAVVLRQILLGGDHERGELA